MPFDENGNWYPDPEQDLQQEEFAPNPGYMAEAPTRDAEELRRRQERDRLLELERLRAESDNRIPQRAPQQQEDFGVQVDDPYRAFAPQQQEATGDDGPGMQMMSQPYRNALGPNDLGPTPGGIIRGIHGSGRERSGGFESAQLIAPRWDAAAPGTFSPQTGGAAGAVGGIAAGVAAQRNTLPPGEAEIRAAEQRLQRLILRPEEQAGFAQLSQAAQTVRQQISQGALHPQEGEGILQNINNMRQQYEARVSAIPRTQRELHDAAQRAEVARLHTMQIEGEEYRQRRQAANGAPRSPARPGVPGSEGEMIETSQGKWEQNQNHPLFHQAQTTAQVNQALMRAAEHIDDKIREDRLKFNDPVQLGQAIDALPQAVRDRLGNDRAALRLAAMPEYLHSPEAEAAHRTRILNERRNAIRQMLDPNFVPPAAAPVAAPAPNPVATLPRPAPENFENPSLLPSERASQLRHILQGINTSSLTGAVGISHSEAKPIGDRLTRMRELLNIPLRENRVPNDGEVWQYQNLQREVAAISPQLGRIVGLAEAPEQEAFRAMASPQTQRTMNRITALRDEAWRLRNEEGGAWTRFNNAPLGAIYRMLEESVARQRPFTAAETATYMRHLRSINNQSGGAQMMERLQLHR